MPKTTGGMARSSGLRVNEGATLKLPAEIFDVEVNIPLIHQVVVAQQAAARQGTHATRTRGKVSGGGKKPYKQKGTGRARQGSIRAPQFVGGGTVHGPQPRRYFQRTPKKMKAAALRGALSDRARNDRVHVVELMAGAEKPSTKTALAALATLSGRSKFLVVLERTDAITWLSLRNVPEVHIVAVDQLNTYDVVASDDVVFTLGAFKALVAPTATELDRGTSDAYAVKVLIFESAVATEAVGYSPAGVPPATAQEELLGTVHGTTPQHSQLLDAAHEAARQQMGTVESYRSTDPTIDGWSVSSDDVEFVAIERHSDHVLITWPSTLNAPEAVKLFSSIAQKADAVYADAGGDEYLAVERKAQPTDWKLISAMPDLRFLRAEIGGEILVWKVAPRDGLTDNRFQVIESNVRSGRLLQLIRRTTDRDVVGLLEEFLGTSELHFEPLNAAG